MSVKCDCACVSVWVCDCVSMWRCDGVAHRFFVFQWLGNFIVLIHISSVVISKMDALHLDHIIRVLGEEREREMWILGGGHVQLLVWVWRLWIHLVPHPNALLALATNRSNRRHCTQLYMAMTLHDRYNYTTPQAAQCAHESHSRIWNS